MKVIHPLAELDSEEQGLRLFLAGGISNCPDWQKETISLLSKFNGLILINPRREKFDNASKEEMRQQIHWEAKMIEASHAFLFWFPCETLCPITLFEYGKVLKAGNPVFVGADPNYPRRFDLIEQSTCMNSSIKVQASLQDTVAQFLTAYGLGDGNTTVDPRHPQT